MRHMGNRRDAAREGHCDRLLGDWRGGRVANDGCLLMQAQHRGHAARENLALKQTKTVMCGVGIGIVMRGRGAPSLHDRCKSPRQGGIEAGAKPARMRRVGRGSPSLKKLTSPPASLISGKTRPETTILTEPRRRKKRRVQFQGRNDRIRDHGFRLSKWQTGGEGGIRTHGALRHSAFRVRCDRPLCHLSGDRRHTGVAAGTRERRTAFAKRKENLALAWLRPFRLSIGGAALAAVGRQQAKKRADSSALNEDQLKCAPDARDGRVVVCRVAASR